MVEYLDQNAEEIILIVVVLLAFVSALVFLGAIYSRWLLKLSQKESEKIREELSPLVIRYISGDIKYEELKNQLYNLADYKILLKISNELEKDLEGEERKKLKRLLNLKPIREFFTERFETGDALDAARACIYFAKRDKIKSSIIPKLVEKSNSDYPMLAYSAALAVITHGNIEQKELVIKNLLKNPGLSNQAMNDIFNEYQLRSSRDRNAEANLLMKLIESKNYQPVRVGLMVRTLGELNFYQSASFLLNQYKQLDTGSNPMITTALIDVLSRFGMEEILDKIHDQFITSEYREVRESAAKAMGVFTKEESVQCLKNLLFDKDFYVRFYAAKSLSNYPDIELENLKVHGMSESDWSELVGEIKNSKLESF